MSSRITAGGVFVLALAALSSPAAAATLCQKSERTVYACTLEKGGKTVSLCEARGRWSYRFGRPGKIELSYGGAGAITEEFELEASLSAEHIQQASSASVSFSQKGHTYTVYQSVFANQLDGHGITVTLPSGKKIELGCRVDDPDYHLEHDLFTEVEKAKKK